MFFRRRHLRVFSNEEFNILHTFDFKLCHYAVFVVEVSFYSQGVFFLL